MAEQIGMEAVLDVSKFNAGLDRYLQGVQGMENQTGRTASSLGRAWDNMGQAAVGAASVVAKTLAGAALAAGAAIVGVGVAAFDVSRQTGEAAAQMAASLGIPIEEAERFAEVARQAYGKNFAESIGEAGEAVTTVTKTLGLAADDPALGRITENALKLKSTFGTEVGESISTVKTLMDNFGISSDEAFDLMTAGYQRGLDRSGDMIDSINEYSTQFANGGASAEEFFGLMDAGLAGGALGTDKAADAFKEFRVRILDGSTATKDALAQIGLSQEELTRQIDNGTLSVADAWNLVVGKLGEVDDQSVLMQAGVGLIGTQFEDLGQAAVLNMKMSEDAYAGAAGATDMLSAKYTSLGSMGEAVWRRLTVAISPATDLLLDLANAAIPHLMAAFDSFEQNVLPQIMSLVAAFAERLPGAMAAAMGVAGQIGGALTFLGEQLSGLSWVVDILNAAVDLVYDNLDAFKGALVGIGIVLAGAGIAAAISAISAAIATISLPIVAVIASAALLGAAWNTNFLGIRDITLQVVNAVTEAFAPLTAAISAFGTDSLAEIWAFVTGNAMGFAATTAIWNGAVESVRNLFNSIVAYVTENLPTWTANLLEWGNAAVNWIGVAATNVTTKVSEWASALMDALTTHLPTWVAKITEWSAALTNWIGIAVAPGIVKLGEWASAILAGLATHLPIWIEKLYEYAAVLVNWIGVATTNGITKLGEWATSLVTWITGQGKTQLEGSTPGLASSLIDWITTDLIPKVGPTMLGYGAALLGAVVNIANALGVAALSIGAAIWAGIMATDWKAVGNNILNAIKDGWNTAKDAVLVALTAIATAIKEKFTAIDWKAVGTSALNLIKDGWQLASASVQLAIALVATAIKEKFTSIDWKAVGTNALTAIKDGWETTKAAVLLVIGTVATAIKDLFTSVDWKTIGSNALTYIKDGVEFAKTTVLPIIGAVATSVMEKFTATDWNQVGKDIAVKIKDGLKTAAELINGLIAAAGTIVTSVLAKFTGGDWSGTGTTIMTTLATAVKAAVALPAGLMYVVGQIAVGMLEEFTGIDFTAAATKMMTALATGIRTAVDAAGGLIEKVKTISTEVVSAFTSVDWATEVGTYIMDAVRDGIMSAVIAAAGLYAKVKEIPAAIVKIFTDAATSWTGIGTDIVAGMKQGIVDAWDGLVSTLKEKVDILPDSVKTFLGISSPSRVFAEIGRNVVQGLIVGLQSEGDKLRDAVNALSRQVIATSFEIAPSFAFTGRSNDWIQSMGESIEQYDDATQKEMRERINTLSWYTRNAAEVERRVGVVADKMALLSHAAQLGIDVQKYDTTTNLGVDTLRDYMNLEMAIAQTKERQLATQIATIKRQQQLNRLIDNRFLDAKADGSFAARFKAQVIDPLLNAMNTLNPGKMLTDFYQASSKLLSLGESQSRVSFLKEQVGLLKQAADAGLNLSQLFPNTLIGNQSVAAAGQMLDIVTKISQASEQSLIQEILAMKEAQKHQQGLAAAMKQLQPIIDKTAVSSVFGQEYKARVLDPILASLEKAAGIDSERVRLMNEYTAAAQQLVQIQQKEKQLSFLQQQLDMIRMIHDQDLPGSSTIFDGLALGVNASINDLTTLTSRVLDSMIKQVKDQLQIASPSKVFVEIGGQMMAGLAQGIQNSVMGPVNALRHATVAHGDVSTRTVNISSTNHVYNQMDMLMLESTIIRTVERALTA